MASPNQPPLSFALPPPTPRLPCLASTKDGLYLLEPGLPGPVTAMELPAREVPKRLAPASLAAWRPGPARVAAEQAQGARPAIPEAWVSRCPHGAGPADPHPH